MAHSRTVDELVAGILEGKHAALARSITAIENQENDYRALVSRLYEHVGRADVIGITGSPGAGKSTLVDKLAKHYRDEGLTVGVIGIDPSSPFTGGAVLGDRIRMAATSTDMDVFFRSMSARGNLGGLSTATADTVRALDAFGKDKVIVETVGAGQNEIDVVKTADTVAVLVPPGTGDDVQMLKAGILEIGDIFVVNKADLPGSDRTVTELRNMLEQGTHGPADWKPQIVETVATEDEGVQNLIDTLQEHADWLDETGQREERARTRTAEEIRTILRDDASALLEDEISERGGIDELARRVLAGETDPYTLANDIMTPIETCVETQHND